MSKQINYSDTLSCHPTSLDTTNSTYQNVNSSYPITNGYTDSTSTTYAQFVLKTGSQAYTYIIYNFDTSDIPDGATITSVSCKAKGYVSSTSSRYVSTRTMQMYTGSTAKGSTVTVSNSATEQTLSIGTWTLSELRNAKIRMTIRRGTSSTNSTSYYCRFYGATLTINYTVSGTAYTIDATSNVSGVTVEPSTQDIMAGQSGEIKINTSSLNNITVTDNGNNINSQLIHISETTGSYDIETTGTYGFALNANDYYESQNKGIDKSAAVCRISFSLPVSSTITVQYINYAEASYDFGVFGNVDVALNTNYYPAGSSGATISDSSYMRACNTSSYNSSSVQTLTYSNVSAGDHFIDIKFSKDDGTASNNDTLQFKITITYSQTVSYYSYTINNIAADHTILVAAASTPQDSAYFKVNGTWRQVSQIYKKINGTWVLQTNYGNVFTSGTNYKT